MTRFWDGEKWVEGWVLGEMPTPGLDAEELVDGMECADALERAFEEHAPTVQTPGLPPAGAFGGRAMTSYGHRRLPRIEHGPSGEVYLRFAENPEEGYVSSARVGKGEMDTHPDGTVQAIEMPGVESFRRFFGATPLVYDYLLRRMHDGDEEAERLVDLMVKEGRDA